MGLAFTGCDKTLAVVWLCLSVCFNGAVYSGFQVSGVIENNVNTYLKGK